MQNEFVEVRSHLTDQQKMRFRLWLQRQYEVRRQNNPKFSLRAFASVLRADSSSVSQILSGKRSPSRRIVQEICQRLAATPKDLRVLGLTERRPGELDAYQLSVDVFSAIADWYHFAIVELTSTRSFNSDPKWIASRLGISVLEAKAAIERLLRLGLLKRVDDSLKRTHEMISNHTGMDTSAARKALQKQIVSKALVAIDETPQEEKDITSMTMAIDPEKLDLAREMIKNFRRDLCALLEDGEQTQVYHLAVQLYPVSKKAMEDR